MEACSGELQCVGKLEIAKPNPVSFLCGSLPVPTDSAFPVFQPSALLPSSSPHAIVAPRYQMLPAETDLNALPLPPNLLEKVFPSAIKGEEGPHWVNSYVSQNLSQKCEALAVSGLTEYGDEIDVVAPTDILKQIFKMPYSKARLSVAVHRVGDTLILNAGPDIDEGEKVFRKHNNQSKASDRSIFLNFAMHSVRMEACDCPPSHQPSSENQTSSTILPGHFGHRESPFVSPANSNATKTQFLDQNVSANKKSSQDDHEEYLWGTKHKKTDHIKKASQIGGKQKFPVKESDKHGRVGSNGFLRVFFWQFHNFRMLLGSDLLMFSNDKYAAVSLHLWDVSRQATPLAWLDAWLDNIMASAPELAICYHENGVIQGYELLKTDDIFLLKGVAEDGTPAFHPQVVQQNGLSVLRFLQDNCKQDPGAYWLYKGAGEDVIQLFDLTIVTSKTPSDDHDKSCGSLPSLLNKGRKDSLFSLATLLYRVAHRLSLSKAPDSIVRCAKFFKKCLDFLSEQDHLVVRAYAHEEFARLILNCYEELELASESYLLESEVTVTDLEDESSELYLETFASKSREIGLADDTESVTLKDEKMMDTHGSEISGISEVERDTYPPLSVSFSSAVEEEQSESKAILRADDSFITCQSSSSPLMTSVADPISSKLVAIHHVSQAIKSLRWKRRLQNAEGNLVDHGNRNHERSSYANFSFCTCGDADCIEVCDIREWLPKSKIDGKMWKLVLLLGESYLSLGEAYLEDGQLHRVLKVVELACLIYGSMPQHIEDAQFISSMTNSLSCPKKFKIINHKMNMLTDGANNRAPVLEDVFSDGQRSPTCLFWAKAWSLVGDVYLEYHMTRGKDIAVQAKTDLLGGVIRMSNEVVKEVKRLKKKLGQYKQNCSTCSLINCSCQSDRANSGHSASSSSGDSQSSYGRKTRKLMTRNLNQQSALTEDNKKAYTMSSASSYEAGRQQSYKHSDRPIGSMRTNVLKETFPNHDIVGYDTKINETLNDEPCTKDSLKARNGGIFKFMEGPKSADVDYNLSAALECYNAACKAMHQVPIGSADFQTILRKRGWVSNELGRYLLEKGDLAKAESAFADAIYSFNEVSDHVNIILVNCNLGHGRRALAEELVSKMEDLKKYDYLQKAYKESARSAKIEYVKSIKYYTAAKAVTTAASDAIETSLRNEVLTQYAHTYLRYGMLLAKEKKSNEDYGNNDSDELPFGERNNEDGNTVISASDAFREALSTYESLGELRKQEAAFAHFHLACYYRDLCLKFLDLDQKIIKHSKSENKNNQKAKWYASLAEKNWHKSLSFYGSKTHSLMYLTILLEQSAFSQRLSSCFHSNTMLEAALALLLEGRHVVEDTDCSWDKDPIMKEKFWSQLLALLKNMVAASLSGGGNKHGAASQSAPANNAGKLRELYRIALKSISFGDLHDMHRLWIS